MLLSSSTGPQMKHFDYDEIIKQMADAGFDAMDFSFFSTSVCSEPEDGKCEFFTELRKKAEDKGLVFNQAHAPMPSSEADPVRSAEIFDSLVKSMKYASYLGVKNIIIHPVQHMRYYDPGVPERLFELNMDFYKRLIPYCEEFGITVATENMWQYRAGRVIDHSTCSRPEEFVRYIDSIASTWVVACLDIGHAALVREDIPDFIRALGKNRLKALHVHDVDGIADIHTLPYYGGLVDWDGVTSALAEIGYEGDFTYEADGFLSKLPKELYPPALKHMAATGRYLMNKIKG